MFYFIRHVLLYPGLWSCVAGTTSLSAIKDPQAIMRKSQGDAKVRIGASRNVERHGHWSERNNNGCPRTSERDTRRDDERRSDA